MLDVALPQALERLHRAEGGADVQKASESQAAERIRLLRSHATVRRRNHGDVRGAGAKPLAHVPRRGHSGSGRGLLGRRHHQRVPVFRRGDRTRLHRQLRGCGPEGRSLRRRAHRFIPHARGLSGNLLHEHAGAQGQPQGRCRIAR